MESTGFHNFGKKNKGRNVYTRRLYSEKRWAYHFRRYENKDRCSTRRLSGLLALFQAKIHTRKAHAGLRLPSSLVTITHPPQPHYTFTLNASECAIHINLLSQTLPMASPSVSPYIATFQRHWRKELPRVTRLLGLFAKSEHQVCMATRRGKLSQTPSLENSCAKIVRVFKYILATDGTLFFPSKSLLR